MLKQESKSKLLASNTGENYNQVLKYTKFIEAPINNNVSKRFKSTGRPRVEGSTFGKVYEQTLSCALKSRMILKNNYGMVKESSN